MVERCQALLCWQVGPEGVLLAVFVPLLELVVVLPDEVSSDLVVEDSLDRLYLVVDRKPDQHFGLPVLVVVHHRRRRDRVLEELIAQQVPNFQLFYVDVELFLRFLLAHFRQLPQLFGNLQVHRPLKYPDGNFQVSVIRLVVLFRVLVLLVMDVGYVGVDEERVVLGLIREE